MSGSALAETVFDDFSGDAQSRWDFVADTVMGGVSSGVADISGKGPEAVLRLQGKVSTANNGGFVQVRQRFTENWSASAKGLRLTVKGNGERYFIFLKTPKLSRVWHSYRAPFVATEDWQTVDLPFERFTASHSPMPVSFAPDEVTSLALVAYGADYQADVSLKSILLY